MPHLYSINKPQTTICAFTGATRDAAGRFRPRYRIGLDYLAPIIRNTPDGARELAMARWGMPGLSLFGGGPIAAIRDIESAHWQRWLAPENRCLVPWTSYCEYTRTKSNKIPTWFAFDKERPLAVFAGIWTTWYGSRGTSSRPVEGEHQLFGFLTTDPNADMRAVEAMTMPVILTNRDEMETWMTAPPDEALKLRQTLPSRVLQVVATDEKKDGHKS